MNLRLKSLWALAIPLLLIAFLLRWLSVIEASPSAICSVPGDFSTIQEAVAEPLCETILVGSGTFPVVTVFIDRNVTIVGQGQDNTILDGEDRCCLAALWINGPTVVKLTDLTIKNGRAEFGGAIFNTGMLSIANSTLSNNHSDFGGAITNLGTLTMTNGTLFGNEASGLGGGIYNERTLTIVDSLLFANTAGSGGAVYNFGTGTLNLINSTLAANSAGDWGGGISNDGTIIVSDSDLLSNSAGSGGGGINNRAKLRLTGSTLSDNSAGDFGLGGGILNEEGGQLTITNSTLKRNVGNGGGGGVYSIDSSSAVTITNSTLLSNTTNFDGGGINNLATLSLTNSTLSGNSAGFWGGGIHNTGALTLTHSTLMGNSALVGGGIRNSSTVNLSNSIVANHPMGGDCATGPGHAAITSLGFNLDSDGTCNLTAGDDQPDTDPLLGPLRDNGGTTTTFALLPGSPALDAGYCPAAGNDQRGLPRPVDLPYVANVADACDIGAFEVQANFVYLPVILKPG